MVRILPTTTDDDEEGRIRRLTLLLAVSSYSITLLYLFFGGTSQGKTWFRNLLPHDNNGDLLLLVVFTLPLFIVTAVAILLLEDGDKAAAGNKKRQDNCFAKNRRTHQTCYDHIRSTTRRILASSRLFTAAFVILPCVVFFLCGVKRHYMSAIETYPDRNMNSTDEITLLEEDQDYYHQITAWRWSLLHHVSNVCAIVGLIAFSHLLIPVAKHNPLIVLLNWTPQEAMVMHKYAGSLAICGTALHGFGHLIHAYWRWWRFFVVDYRIPESNLQSKNWMEKSFWRGFLPPRICWQQKLSSNNSTQLNFGPGCISDDVSCSCEDFFINFTGLLGLVALLVLMVGSFNHIRRRYYKLFYIVHITAAPLFILAAILHCNRAILYMCPSLLYYASTAVPAYVESWLSRRLHYKCSRILAVSKIPCPSDARPNGNVLSIEFEASRDTMTNFTPGSHCILQIPSISLVAHPFTVNIVPYHSNRLRVLVRQVGPFTTQLVELLEASIPIDEKKECDIESQNALAISLPKVCINMYGIGHRMKQMYHHDLVLIVAGGIGITPYLSMLMQIVASSQENSSLKSVILHWVCRDAALIRFVYEEYLAAILEKSKEADRVGGGGVTISIFTHYTGSDDAANFSNYCLEPVRYHVDSCDGAPVKYPFYSVRNTRTFLVTFASIFSLGMIEVVRAGIFGLLVICIISILISTVSFLLLNAGPQIKKTNNLSRSTDESYGSTSYTQKSQGADHTNTNDTFGYEFIAKGRPSELTLFSSFQEYENPGLFLCGPSSMTKQLRLFLSKSEHKDTDVYEEVFEL